MRLPICTYGFDLLRLPWHVTRLGNGIFAVNSFLSFTSEPCIRVRVWAAMPPCRIANPNANTRLRGQIQGFQKFLGLVKYKLSAFFLKTLQPVYERACALSNLSYSPNLALTPLSARMRGARAPACSYTGCKGFEKSKWLILNHLQTL